MGKEKSENGRTSGWKGKREGDEERHTIERKEADKGGRERVRKMYGMEFDRKKKGERERRGTQERRR